MTETCSNCRFSLEENRNIYCRKNPPQAAILLMPVNTLAGQSLQPTPFCAFPFVQPNQWCGQWENGVEGTKSSKLLLNS